MKRLYDRLKKHKYKLDDSGAALLTVVIVTVFITILATTLLYISSMNYQMKQADYQNKQSFYKCETLLDDLKGRLAADVSVAFQESYRAVMLDYTALDASSRQEEFQKAYMAAMNDIWYKNADWSTGKHYWTGTEWKHESADGGRVSADSPSEEKYSAALRSYMEFDTVNSKYGGDIEGDFDIKWMGDNAGVFITQIDNCKINAEDEMITTESERLFVLKGIRASFVTKYGYSSYIVTDLGVKIPYYDFTEMNAVEDLSTVEPVRMSDCVIYVNWKRF